jgi:hypothetical protein
MLQEKKAVSPSLKLTYPQSQKARLQGKKADQQPKKAELLRKKAGQQRKKAQRHRSPDLPPGPAKVGPGEGISNLRTDRA